MMLVRRSNERGHANHGWLGSAHTFSFADYYDPQWMGFGHLRVINEDRVAPGRGFGAHPHRDMEIISYVLEGGLTHRDSMGNGSTIHADEVQVMSAGSGVTHSELNASPTEEVHFLQIWILPAEKGTDPRYQQKRFDRAARLDRFVPLVSPDGRDGSLQIRQDATIYGAVLSGSAQVDRRVDADRVAWLHVARGKVVVDGVELAAGDAAAFADAGAVTIANLDGGEVLWFDLPARSR